MPSEANLLIAIPTLGAIHPILASRLIRWAGTLPRDRVHFYFAFKVAPVDRARNQIAKVFMNDTTHGGTRQFTHLLMIDSDTIPPEDAVTRLLAHGSPIVTGLTPIVTYDGKDVQTYDNAFLARETDENGIVTKTHVAPRRTGLKEVFRCGASCILIAREVFEKLDQPYFRFVPNEDNTKHVRSEDIDFCDRVRALGYRILADTDVVCQHSKEVLI
jgi:GT2 family glycosyltransferase